MNGNDNIGYIMNINIDRRSGTNINECKLLCDGIPYIDGVPLVRKSITNSDNVIVTGDINISHLTLSKAI